MRKYYHFPKGICVKCLRFMILVVHRYIVVKMELETGSTYISIIESAKILTIRNKYRTRALINYLFFVY